MPGSVAAPPPPMLITPNPTSCDPSWEKKLRAGKRPKTCHPSSVLKSCKGNKDIARDITWAKPAGCKCAKKGVFGLNCGKGYLKCAKKGAKAKTKKCPKGEGG